MGIVSARSGAEGVRHPPVITDMKMESDTAGYDVVRAAGALPDPPVIMILTGYPLLAQDWRAAGADAVVSKPTLMAQLLETVAELVHKRGQRATRLA